VVHEWFFYNAIFPYKWDPCLSKGFATFLGIYAADKVILYLALILLINYDQSDIKILSILCI